MSLQNPKTHIDLSSEEGKSIFLAAASKSSFMKSYWKLSQNHEQQVTPSFCGIASSVMVLNSLNSTKTSRPPSSHMSSYHFYDQTNVFQTKDQQMFKTSAGQRGMTFKELETFIGLYDDVSVSSIRALDSNKSDFLQALKDSLCKDDTFVILYYDRAQIGEDGSWHISPIGGYSPDKGCFLRMDVARVKYESAWIPKDDLWKSVNCGTMIGYDGGIVIVAGAKSKKEVIPKPVKKPISLMTVVVGYTVVVLAVGVLLGWFGCFYNKSSK